MTVSTVARAIALAALILAGGRALAHPHVWVTARAQLIYRDDGKVTAVRHRWTFDPGYSAYVTQGLDTNGDGRLAPEEMQELAKTNTESLVEFDYFTVLKAGGVKQAFDAPRAYGMTFDQDAATLSFDLPLKRPAAARTLALEIYDPTYFVSFSMAPGEDAVSLANAPRGCAKTITRPKPIDAAQQQNLSEQFFQALTAASDVGADFASRVIVACP